MVKAEFATPIKKAISYFRSYHDVCDSLDDAQYATFNRTIMRVSFFQQNINSVQFKHKTLQILWLSIRHSLVSQIEGFLNKNGVSYAAMLGACQGGYEGGCQAPCRQEEVEGQEEGEEQGSYLRSKGFSVIEGGGSGILAATPFDEL